MKRFFRIIVRLILLPFVVLWQFSDLGIIPSLKGIIQWVLMYPHTDRGLKDQVKQNEIYNRLSEAGLSVKKK